MYEMMQKTLLKLSVCFIGICLLSACALEVEKIERPENSYDYSAIQMGFVNLRGKRIVLIGQIWSLGNYTGSITLIAHDS